MKTSTADDIKSATAYMTREEHDRWFSHLICYGYAPLPAPKRIAPDLSGSGWFAPLDDSMAVVRKRPAPPAKKAAKRKAQRRARSVTRKNRT